MDSDNFDGNVFKDRLVEQFTSQSNSLNPAQSDPSNHKVLELSDEAEEEEESDRIEMSDQSEVNDEGDTFVWKNPSKLTNSRRDSNA